LRTGAALKIFPQRGCKGKMATTWENQPEGLWSSRFTPRKRKRPSDSKKNPGQRQKQIRDIRLKKDAPYMDQNQVADQQKIIRERFRGRMRGSWEGVKDERALASPKTAGGGTGRGVGIILRLLSGKGSAAVKKEGGGRIRRKITERDRR